MVTIKKDVSAKQILRAVERVKSGEGKIRNIKGVRVDTVALAREKFIKEVKSERQGKVKKGKASVFSKKKSKRLKKKKAQKILRKPTIKLPSASPTKFVAQLAQAQPGLVREVPNPYVDPVQDNRSQFFRESYAEEKRKALGGFL